MKPLLTRILLIFALAPGLVFADKPTDSRAIVGMQTGKILWDITLSNPKRLIARLNVIEETHQDMIRQGLQPKMVFAFRGGAAGLIAQDTDQLNLELAAEVLMLHERIKQVQKLEGVHMEACAIAARRFHLDQKDLLPGITLVGNTFLSIMGYQNQGFAIIKID
jgi:intracellular sulfur oxidation DsrE/DsrF family protein